MAKKTGAWDLRCNEAVLSAMLTHPRYRDAGDFARRGVEVVTRGDWSFAFHLPAEEAHDALAPALETIARKQQRSGMWFRKNAEAHSWGILRALKHSGHLDEMIANGRLRHDPFQGFAARNDAWGLLVRRNIMGRPADGDDALQARLVDKIISEQMPDGDWDGAVSATALRIERLLDLGMYRGNPPLDRAGKWILGQFRESVERRRPRASWSIFIPDTFTADCGAEFRAAQRLLPELTMARACFASIPILQTALAVRALVRLGRGDDKRVIRACESLLEMEVKPHEKSAGKVKLHPGWCAHQ